MSCTLATKLLPSVIRMRGTRGTFQVARRSAAIPHVTVTIWKSGLPKVTTHLLLVDRTWALKLLPAVRPTRSIRSPMKKYVICNSRAYYLVWRTPGKYSRTQWESPSYFRRQRRGDVHGGAQFGGHSADGVGWRTGVYIVR